MAERGAPSSAAPCQAAAVSITALTLVDAATQAGDSHNVHAEQEHSLPEKQDSSGAPAAAGTAAPQEWPTLQVWRAALCYVVKDPRLRSLCAVLAILALAVYRCGPGLFPSSPEVDVFCCLLVRFGCPWAVLHMITGWEAPVVHESLTSVAFLFTIFCLPTICNTPALCWVAFRVLWRDARERAEGSGELCKGDQAGTAKAARAGHAALSSPAAPLVRALAACVSLHHAMSWRDASFRAHQVYSNQLLLAGACIALAAVEPSLVAALFRLCKMWEVPQQSVRVVEQQPVKLVVVVEAAPTDLPDAHKPCTAPTAQLP